MNKIIEIVKIVIKDIFAQKRNVFLMVAIGFAAFSIVIGGAYNKGIEVQLIELMRGSYSGDFSIFHKDVRIKSSPTPLMVPLNKLLVSQEDLVSKLSIIEGVEMVLPRLVVLGSYMGESEIENVYVNVIGIDFTKEEKYALKALEFRENPHKTEDTILISEKTAKKLNLKMGDDSYVFLTGKGGLPIPLKLKVGGIFVGKGFPAVVENLVYVDYRKLKSVLGFSGDAYSSLVVMANGKAKDEKLMKNIEKILPSEWKVLPKEKVGIFFYNIAGTIGFFKIFSYFLQYITIFLFVYSTLLVSVNNRKKDIGIMYSLGLDRIHIFLFFSLEGFLIAFLPAVVFSLIGSVVVFVFGIYGIPAFNEAMRYMFASNVLYLRHDGGALFSATIGFGLVGFIGALGPVLMRLRERPLRLLRDM